MSVRVLEGHVVSVLAGEPAGHYHVAVTSPPYLWLRSYGTPPQTWPDGWVGELGQEETPERYVDHLVTVFRAVGRVLRDDACLFVNLAGMYFNDPGGQNGAQGTVSAKAIEANAQNGRQKRGRHPWLKPLDYVDIPGLFAHAMQCDGWTWRSDIALVKRSPMPESVTGWAWSRCRVKVAKGANQRQGDTLAADGWVGNSGGFGSVQQAEWADCPGCPRCQATDGYVLRRGNGRPTRAWERLLLFTKRGGGFFDTEAVREPLSEATLADGRLQKAVGLLPEYGRSGKPPRGPSDEATRFIDTNPAGRNARDWQYWADNGKLKDEHYAASPSAIPSFAIRAGTSEWGCCPGCGAPYARVVSRAVRFEGGSGRAGNVPEGKWAGSEQATSGDYDIRQGPVVDTATLGWRPTCRCSPVLPPAPCRVLDCFAGSGTTALAANRLGRDCTLVELKPAYAALAKRRIGREPLSLFATHGEAVGASAGVGVGGYGRWPS